MIGPRFLVSSTIHNGFPILKISQQSTGITSDTGILLLHKVG